MKFLLISSVILKIVSADFAKILNQTKVLEEQMVKEAQLTRTVGFNAGLLSGRLEQINGYGCWCYFQGDHGKGKGTPVNEVDTFCRYLHDGYECAIRDSKEEGHHCTPWKVDYNPAISLGGALFGPGNDATIDFECAEKNPGNKCAERACLIEGYFVLNIMDSFFKGIMFDPTKAHKKGFEPADHCPGQGGSGHRKSGIACCGIYPRRFPFRTLDGHRECCGTKAYNTLTNFCCSDGIGGKEVQSVSCL